MEAAEEADDGVEACVGLLVVDSLEPLLQLVVAVRGYVVRRQGALVHEVLERHVAVLLKAHVIQETLLHHRVDLRFKCQQLSSEFNWILLQSLICDDFLSSTLNIWLHLLNDVLESALYSPKDTEHERQFFEFRVLEHAITARALLIHDI